MDFVVGLPMTRKSADAVWVIVDRLTKAAHFLPIRMIDSLERLCRYISTKLFIFMECPLYLSFLAWPPGSFVHEAIVKHRFPPSD